MSNRGHALRAAFEDGRQFALGGRTVTLRATDAGPVAVPSGRLVPSGPFLAPWRPPFTTRIPPGRYPVHLALAEGGE